MKHHWGYHVFNAKIHPAVAKKPRAMHRQQLVPGTMGIDQQQTGFFKYPLVNIPHNYRKIHHFVAG